MNLTFTAVYEGGVMRPTVPLPLEEGATVLVVLNNDPVAISEAPSSEPLRWVLTHEEIRAVAEDDEFAAYSTHDEEDAEMMARWRSCASGSQPVNNAAEVSKRSGLNEQLRLTLGDVA